MDIESLRDVVISEMILRVKKMTRGELERQLISVEGEKIESLKDLKEIINYGREKSKN